MPYKFSYLYQFTAKVFIDFLFYILKVTKLKKKSLYIFTDSRGFYVNKWYCKKNPLFSYIDILSKDYKINYSLCNYKHTTILDFLCDYFENIHKHKYDTIIIHLGVVDFSPRTKKQAEEVLKLKKERLLRVFNLDSLPELAINEYEDTYEGSQTASIYTTDFLKNFIIDKINSIDTNIIWIGVNRVIADWNGNYEKKRPSHINCIMDYQQVINDYFNGEVISLSNLSDEEIKSYTVDNIHLSLDGFRYISKLIESKLKETTAIK